jgi:L-alanine-DL-glutamate epimerase-like enolase superfamily enzyme
MTGGMLDMPQTPGLGGTIDFDKVIKTHELTSFDLFA